MIQKYAIDHLKILKNMFGKKHSYNKQYKAHNGVLRVLTSKLMQTLYEY